MQKIIAFLVGILPVVVSGCSVAMLAHRDSKTSTIYRSSSSGSDYFIINATTLSNCGCTELHIDNYKNSRKAFRMIYNNGTATKTVYTLNSSTQQTDTLQLLSTMGNNFTVGLDSLDRVIFSRIDSIYLQQPKAIIYSIKKPLYKGFVPNPYYNR